ncbi:hypothetical protein [Yoonia litorea]|uniref:Uncharacterized protein n=1 Tax=Yoonia litorea TaxID=1123755 RepID=A0A1I6MWK1_9RHOB|nr:hypothetical protein [Yoonia litorea]SFS20072.1 hypothetical protein SAMN05444714_2469 [Yoonia litorea]
MAMYAIDKEGTDIARDAEAFFAEVADDDLLKFLSQLPMIWGNEERMTVADFTYEAMLWPFIKDAWRKIDGSPGLAGRLGQLDQVFDHAEKHLEKETGRTRRVPRTTNLASFMQIFMQGKLQA